MIKDKKNYLIILFCFILQLTFSQSNFVIGKLVMTKGDTISGYINSKDYSLYGGLFSNDNIKFKAKLDSEKIKYTIEDVQSIFINTKTYRKITIREYDYFSERDIISSSFMENHRDGALMVYTNKTIRSSGGSWNGGVYMGGGTNTITNYYIGKKGSDMYQEVNKSGFKKMILNLISDDTQLYNSLKGKKLKKEELMIIVEIYNRHAKRKHRTNKVS